MKGDPGGMTGDPGGKKDGPGEVKGTPFGEHSGAGEAAGETQPAAGETRPAAEPGPVKSSNGAARVYQPPASRRSQEQRDLELVMHQLLVTGVTVAMLLMLLGLVLSLARTGGVPDQVPPLDQVIRLAVRLDPGGVLALGLLALIATPILRVAGSVIAFIYERDWRYALITFIVFLIVVASILVGRGG